MTEKTEKYSADVDITVNYDTGKTTIHLEVFNNKALVAGYVLDSIDIYENTSSTTHRKAMEKYND